MLLEVVVVLVIGVLYFLKYSFSEPEEKISTLYENQSLVEPGPERIRSSRLYTSENGQVFKRSSPATLYDTFRQGARLSNNGNCVGWRGGPNRSYIWQNYNDTLQRAKNFGSGLVSLGLPPGQTSNLGICLKNCPEWVMTELAAYTYSMVLVPLYDTLGAEATVFIMDRAQLTIIVCEDDAKAKDLFVKSSRHLKTIITLQPVTPLTKEEAKRCNVDLYTFAEVEELGASHNHPSILPKPDDLCTISYTSGTTGEPKGVMLTHANIVDSVESIAIQFGDDKYNKDDVMLSFLPLAHCFQRLCDHMVYASGGAVGFFSGDLLKVNEDTIMLQPTLLVTVPRLLNKIYDKIMSTECKSKTKESIFKLALYAKEKKLNRGLWQNDTIWDRFVLRKFRNVMGGKLRLVISGAAPLSTNVKTFIQCVFGCKVVEGYGQTECLAASTSLCGDNDPGSVGPPVPCSKIKLIDVPEMEYYAENDQGEVCVKGTNVFQGYYLDPEKTKEVFDDDGWLHTGDIGAWSPKGGLKIIDRKKQIFKLAQGEYIAPEKIQNAYSRSLFVEQVLVHGESLKSTIIAIVVPCREAVIDWALTNDIPGPFASLCQDRRVKGAIMKDMLEKGKMADLKSFEQVKDIYLHPELFSVENNFLTPSLKMKRKQITDLLKKEINDMYSVLV